MLLEDYFDFLAPDDIRIKGSRIGIETVLYEHIHRGRTPEEIVKSYPSLSMEQIHAAILYYLHNRNAVSAYLADILEAGRQAHEAQGRNPSPFVLRLREMKAEARAQNAA